MDIEYIYLSIRECGADHALVMRSCEQPLLAQCPRSIYRSQHRRVGEIAARVRRLARDIRTDA